MHNRDRGTHQDGARDLGSAQGRWISPKIKRQHQSDKGNYDGCHKRKNHEPCGPMAHGGQPHGSHAGVVHGGDPAAHEKTSAQGAERTHLFAAHNKEGNRGGEDGRKQRKDDGWPVIENRDRQAESKHANVVHRPNAGSHGNRSAAEPKEANLVPRGADAARQVQRRVGRHDRNYHGKDDQPRVVGASQGLL